MPDRLVSDILQAAERAGVMHRFDGSEYVLFATRKQLLAFAGELERVPPPAACSPQFHVERPSDLRTIEPSPPIPGTCHD